MKIGFIGIGNMGRAISLNLVKNNQYQIFATAKHQDKLEAFAKENNLTALESNQELVDQSDVVILAVKPNMIENVLKEVQSNLTKEKIIVSLAAGITIEQIELMINLDLPIIRVMPNIAASVGRSATAIVQNENTTDQQLAMVTEIFENCGQVYPIAEKDFPAFIALAGSSPATMFILIDALSRAGVKHGIPKEQATKIAAQAMLGSAELIQDTNDNPWNLVDQVSSPGGTTVAGVLALKETGFEAAVTKAVDAIIQRDQEISDNK